jgi:hypothetical protein
MGVECDKHLEITPAHDILSKNIKVKDYLTDFDVDGKII